jgi:hypothetical protein
MIGSENKMIDSIKYILRNIDISGFKAEFDLETKQVRLELLAEFDELDERLEGLGKLNFTPINRDVKETESEKESIRQSRDPIELAKTNKSEVIKTDEQNQTISETVEEPDNKYPSKISKKIDQFITSGISPSEKLNSKQRDIKKDLKNEI